MIRRRRRLVLITAAVCVLGASVGLISNALRDNIVFSFSPTEIASRQITPGQRIRMGGLVETGSVVRAGKEIRFVLTDMETAIQVKFIGILPDLFREEQGVVVEGNLGADKTFTASNVLAKHDENYMPKEVADGLKASGHWQPAAE